MRRELLTYNLIRKLREPIYRLEVDKWAFLLIVVSLVGVLSLTTEVQAQNATQNSDELARPRIADAAGNQDCTEAKIDFTNDSQLTKAEISKRMDQALFQSLARYDACQTANAASTSSGGGGGGGAGSGSAETGVASSDMSGTESTTDTSQGTTEESQLPTEGLDDKTSDDSGQISLNGKLPEDIPSTDNDSILEAQIRQAAINETDPEVKKRLWNEYRRYKKIPIPK